MNEFKAGTVINEELLRESKHIRGNVAGLKILGGGELKHGLTIEADQGERIGTREDRKGRRDRDLASSAPR